jgi:hypothetical protein
MKIIDNYNKVSIFLNEGDVLEISKDNIESDNIIVERLKSDIYVNKVSIKDINNKYIEEQEIKKMNDLLKNKN